MTEEATMNDPLAGWNDGAAKTAILEFVRAVTEPGTASSRSRSASRRSTTTAPCGARSRCRSRPTSSCGGCTRWRRPIPSCASASPGRRRTSATTRGSARCSPSTTRATTRTCGRSLGGVLAAYAGISVDDFEAQSDAFLRSDAASDPRPRLPRVRVRADGRAARLPGGERVRELHRLGRRPRLHAADQPGGVRHPARAGDRQRLDARVRERRARRHDHAQGRRPTTSTTARRSRSASGAAPAAGRCSPPATPTATSRCSSSPTTRTSRSCALLVLHDDAEREFDYTGGAEQALEQAARMAGRSSASRTTGPRSSSPLGWGDEYRHRIRGRARAVLAQNRAPSELMSVIAAEDAKEGPQRPLYLRLARKWKQCHGA